MDKVSKLRSCVKNLEAETLRLEDVESERDVLQLQVLTKTRDSIGSKNILVPGSDL